MARQPKKETPRERSNPEKEFVNHRSNPFQAKTPKQKELFAALNTSTITFATGCPGTGKSYVAIAYACEGLLSGKFDRILLTRPMIPAAYEDVGTLPGDLTDKFILPYIGPVRHMLDECLGSGHVDMYLKEGRIICSPLAYMRGSTYNRTCMILDESQNCVPEQLKMVLTRIGQDSQCIIAGDSMQSDIRSRNGLDDAIERLAWHPNIKIVDFKRSDIVRNSIIADILQSYEDSVIR